MGVALRFNVFNAQKRTANSAGSRRETAKTEGSNPLPFLRLGKLLKLPK